MKRSQNVCLSLLLILACTVLPFRSARGQTAPQRSAAVEHVRQLYYSQDTLAAGKQAEELLGKNPGDTELKAWYVLLERKDKKTLPVFNDLMKLKEVRESLWGLLASARWSSGADVRFFCDAAIAKGADDPDVLVLATSIMSRTMEAARSDDQGDRFGDRIKAFLDAHKEQYERSTEGLAAYARALADLKSDGSYSADVLALCDKALKLNGKNVQALLLKASILNGQGKQQESHDLLQSAVRSVPDCFELRSAYWKAALNSPSGTPQEREKEVISDATQFFSQSMPNPFAVRGTLYSLEESAHKAATAIGDTLLKQYPDTEVSDAVTQVRAEKDLPISLATPDQNRTAKIKALRAFIDRPKHYDDEMLKEANGYVANLLSSQDTPDLDLFYKCVVAANGDALAVTALAGHKVHLPELELLASRQLDDQFGELKNNVLDIQDKDGFIDFWAGNFVSSWQDALGWIYFNEGNFDQAQEKLEASLNLYANNALATIHLGRVYEAKGDAGRAEQLYKDAMGKNAPLSADAEKEHIAVQALREFYIRKHGGNDGLDAYMKPILEQDRERRKKNVLDAKVSTPKEVPAFSLTALDGKKISSESLKGKVVVINFWATWCGPCREELPDYETFYQKYKDSPNVVVLTMATDDVETPTTVVQNFISDNKYTFPVLRGPKYADANSIGAIPVTWFVDPNGKRVFEKTGYTKALMEEFTWRIEAMENSPKPQSAESAAPKTATEHNPTDRNE